jgi:hypothetical protein
VSEEAPRIPGWTPIAFLIAFTAVLLLSRLLNIYETALTGVDTTLRNVTVNATSNDTLGNYMPNLGYQGIAHNVWLAVLSVLAAGFVISAAYVLARAFRGKWEGGEE